jgi:hypothetical protein
MKNLFTLLFIAVLSLGLSNTTNAQEGILDPGEGTHGGALNLFVGFGDDLKVNGHYEIGLTEDITVSPVARIRLGDNTSFALGARADFYFDRLFNLSQSWDIFAGVDTMFDFDTDFDIHGHMGVEYLFSSKWGIIAEFGFGDISSGSLGLGIHF